MTKPTPPAIIAVDGPASSGKSTLGQKLAAALGYVFSTQALCTAQ